MKQTIQVLQWQSQSGPKNFGDLLSEYIINSLFTNAYAVPVDFRNAELLAVGSVLDDWEIRYPKLKGVWGSGFIAAGKKYKTTPPIYSVRGKLTAERLHFTGPLGDPGLLANLVFEPSAQRCNKIGVIPHYTDLDTALVNLYRNDERFIIIDVRRDPEEVIRDITSVDMILSSSLHGLIISDSFGIPNYWVNFKTDNIDRKYKYLDYLSSVSRKESSVLLETNTPLSTDAYKSLRNDWEPVANLELIQRNLIESFPVELVSSDLSKVWITHFDNFVAPPKNNQKTIKIFIGHSGINESVIQQLAKTGYAEIIRTKQFVLLKQKTILSVFQKPAYLCYEISSKVIRRIRLQMKSTV